MRPMLENIRIVLIQTSHPGNIGAVARAMKTMGLLDLYLVAPKQFPHPKAYEMASNAGDVLDNATVVESLDEAISDCTLVVGTSARSRVIPWPVLTPKALAEKVQVEASTNQIAILFGCEQTGLTNDELQRCHYHIQIPANPHYSSLNLAAAVQIIAYELFVARAAAPSQEEDWEFRFATADEMEKFFVHLQEVLVEVDFLKLSAPRKLMTRLRRLFLRARVDVNEMNILRGVLTAVEHKLGK
jgi:tRNA (cytidine32/uridine32-2'-O)-methyltransferase